MTQPGLRRALLRAAAGGAVAAHLSRYPLGYFCGWSVFDLATPMYWITILIGALHGAVIACIVAWGQPKGVVPWLSRAAWLFAAGGAVALISIGMLTVAQWPYFPGSFLLLLATGYYGPLSVSVGCVQGWFPTAGDARLRRLGWMAAALACAVAVLPALLIRELFFPIRGTSLAYAISRAALNGYCLGVAFRLFTEGDPILLPATLPGDAQDRRAAYDP